MFPMYQWLIVMLWLTNAAWCSLRTRSSTAHSHSASHLLPMVNGWFCSKWCPRTEHLHPYGSQLRAHNYYSTSVHRRRNWEKAVSSCSAWLEFLPHYEGEKEHPTEAGAAVMSCHGEKECSWGSLSSCKCICVRGDMVWSTKAWATAVTVTVYEVRGRTASQISVAAEFEVPWANTHIDLPPPYFQLRSIYLADGRASC